MNKKDKLYYDLIEAYRKHSCNDTLITTYVNKVLQLTKDYLKSKTTDEKENQKYKKAIDILKDKTNLKIEKNAQNNPFITYDLWGSSAISKKEYELLKEVLE